MLKIVMSSQPLTDSGAKPHGQRQRFALLREIGKTYYLATVTTFYLALIPAIIAQPEELLTMRGWIILVAVPLMAPLAVPALLLSAFGSLAQYGINGNYAIPATVGFLVVWVSVFYIRRFRSRRHGTPIRPSPQTYND